MGNSVREHEKNTGEMNIDLPPAIPQMPVTNLDRSISYYTKHLGFLLDWKYEDDIAGISNGRLCLFLNKKDNDEPGKTLVWLNLDSKEQVDQLHKRWATDGASIISPPETKPWGLYEFTVSDPDDNKIRVFFDLHS